jgi:hypothetical protein
MSHSHELDHTHGHDHEHDHEHEHEQHEHAPGCHCCNYGEEYYQNIEEQRKRTVSRRDLLKVMGAAGLTLAIGNFGVTNVNASGVNLPTQAKAVPFVTADNDNFYYLSGDHHIHTKYSRDAKYSVNRQVAEANYFKLNWMVITDHGNATHNKIGIDKTVPDIVNARNSFKNMLLFSGLELNIPAAEHGTVMMMPGEKELEHLKEFERRFDGAIAPSVEETMLAGLRFLDSLDPKPLFFANHPARRGLDSPHEIRNWKLTAPEVAYGFEGAPGHQAAGMIKDANGRFTSYRGFYGSRPGAASGSHDSLYGPESYFTYGGFDWMTAKLGGLWDSLLGDGLRWWITANSDAHVFIWDLQDRDTSKFDDTGEVAEVDKYFERPVYGDFAPGEYSRTYVVTPEQSYAGVMAGIRQGNMFVVHGDLINRLRFYATARYPGERDFGGVGVLTGGTFVVRPGSDVRFQVRLAIPKEPNFANDRPMLDHFDLISGQITNAGYIFGNADVYTNPTTKVNQTWTKGDWRASQTADSFIIETEYIFTNVQQDFYARLRGTNTNDYGETPAMDPDMRGKTGPGQNPWQSLWFYSNPIFVLVRS